mgnify:CR=1 FL=1
MEPDEYTQQCTSVTRCGIKEDDKPSYYYFCLKNGARKTVFKVNKDSINTPDIDTYIKSISAIYPEHVEIYPITKEEHDTIRKYTLAIRRIFNKARKRGTIIVMDGVCEDSVKPIADAINNFLG